MQFTALSLSGATASKATCPQTTTPLPSILEDTQATAAAAHRPPRLFPATQSPSNPVSRCSAGSAAPPPAARPSVGGGVLSPPVLRRVPEEPEPGPGGPEPPFTPTAGLVTAPAPRGSSCMVTEPLPVTPAAGLVTASPAPRGSSCMDTEPLPVTPAAGLVTASPAPRGSSCMDTEETCGRSGATSGHRSISFGSPTRPPPPPVSPPHFQGFGSAATVAPRFVSPFRSCISCCSHCHR